MAKQKNIWKFNDEEWKAHIDDKDLFEKVKKNLIWEILLLFIMRVAVYPKKLLGI